MRPLPSVARRGAVALAVLVAFYLTTIAIALALVPLPVLFFLAMDRVHVGALIAVAACCWLPAGLLLSGVLGARPPRFEEPGIALEREQAPALFALLDELAEAAKTTAPTDVYVSATADLFVMETAGGFFGSRSRRVLCIGAPLLATSTVGELRAMLAHELGHYLGGDTKLSGVLAYTEGAFRSVLEATTRGPYHQEGHWAIELAQTVAGAMGKGLVRVFAGIYLRLTRPTKRRQELAADQLSAELAGRKTAIRALEKAHVLAPLYDAYLDEEVSLAIACDAMPTDLLEGFERYRARLTERGDLGKLEAAVAEQKTDPFDTHPALAERVAALRAGPEGTTRVLDASARTVLDGSFDLDTWLVSATLTRVERPLRRPVQRLSWAEIMSHAMPVQLRQRGQKVAALLYANLAQATTQSAMLGAVVTAFEAGRMAKVVEAVEPEIVNVPPQQQSGLAMVIASRTVLTLFEAALLEQGATLEDSLGEPSLVFRFAGETVRPGLIAHGAMVDDKGRRELARWSNLLLAPAPERGPGVNAADPRV